MATILKEPLIKSLMGRVCLQLLMIAKRKPQEHAVAYTPRDATQQVPLVGKPSYIQ